MTTQDDLAASRELDAVVAEKVMRWHLIQAKSISPRGWAKWYDNAGNAQSAGIGGGFNPSKDISAAWLVVERFAAMYGNLTVCQYNGGASAQIWVPGAAFGFRPTSLIQADTAPLAICRAALKAVSG